MTSMDEGDRQEGTTDPGIECYHVADRKVYVPREGDSSVYSICRQWVRGIPAPDMCEFVDKSDLPSTLPDLPEPGPPAEEDPFDHPPLPGAELYEIRTKDPKRLLQLHKEHWVRVRNYHIAKQRFKCQRYKERVKIVCDYAANAVREAKRS
ncbi:hypothetical protein BSKO_10266 [Bryopsis sp. KO-2023]|nr:hypothetical protein BSKO_10266 [Bryopsis sp. KO-2023]